jgi:hypothetical protein
MTQKNPNTSEAPSGRVHQVLLSEKIKPSSLTGVPADFEAS